MKFKFDPKIIRIFVRYPYLRNLQSITDLLYSKITNKDKSRKTVSFEKRTIEFIIEKLTISVNLFNDLIKSIRIITEKKFKQLKSYNQKNKVLETIREKEDKNNKIKIKNSDDDNNNNNNNLKRREIRRTRRDLANVKKSISKRRRISKRTISPCTGISDVIKIFEKKIKSNYNIPQKRIKTNRKTPQKKINTSSVKFNFNRIVSIYQTIADEIKKLDNHINFINNEYCRIDEIIDKIDYNKTEIKK